MDKMKQSETKGEAESSGNGKVPKNSGRGFIFALIGLAVLTLLLVVLAVVIQPIMSPQAKFEATAISITKTAAAQTGAYLDPDLLIEPLPVENVSGIAILGGLMALIILGVVLREFLIWRKKNEG